MAIPTTLSTAERILAIDLGKYKSVECRYESSSGEVAFASFDQLSGLAVERFGRSARPTRRNVFGPAARSVR